MKIHAKTYARKLGLKTYAFELASDTGHYFIRVYASNWKTAIELVCDWQKCPKRAIISKWIVRN